MSFWTKCPNELIDLMPEFNEKEIQLILRVLRHTVGRHEEWAELGESQLLEETKLSRTTLYEAKETLEKDGFLLVDRERRRCAYKIGDLGTAAVKRRARRDDEHGEKRKSHSKGGNTPNRVRNPGPPVRNPGPSEYPNKRGPDIRTQTGPESRTPSISKERTSESKETSSLQLKRTPAADDAFLRSGDDDQVHQVQDDPGHVDLVRRLQAIGMDVHQAEKAAGETYQLALEALEQLPLRANLRNPAGFVVDFCRKGGFSPPADIARERQRRAGLQRRSELRQGESQERDACSIRDRAEWDYLAGQATPGQLAAAEQYARAQLPPAMAESAPSNTGPVRAFMLEYFRSHHQGVA